jgi:phage-related protein
VPRVELVLYREADGTVPLLDWLESLVPQARAKCRARLTRLQELGHELRRPEADYLSADIYELRIKHSRVNYRMLYFFHAQTAVVVSHGFSKQRADVPKRDIEIALRRKAAFKKAPATHTHEEVL